ncbi:alpha/beta hydrolase [Bradyrhizobium sp. 2TAF24]|uniref:alpha/beta hydrolase n=1 Tax=Bradyrhizobium sp. 2TAF24 TaxID=3233011 RepID=UPI003F91E852
MLTPTMILEDISFSGGVPRTDAIERTMTLAGTPAGADTAWEPMLLVRAQASAATDPHRPVLYVHGMSFPSASSIMFPFDGGSWADQLNQSGFLACAFDFAGFGGSERYPEMIGTAPPAGEPLGAADDAARQIHRVVRAILAHTGVARLSIIAHSWGTIAAGLFATRYPELVDRLVFFGPITQRRQLAGVPELGAWRLLTVAEQHARFVEDVPPGCPPLLLERDFPAWATRYLSSDPTSGTRSPPSVKTPNGPLADVMRAWSGSLAYDPGKIRAPVAIIRGAWDSLCTSDDAAWLMAALTSAPDKRDITIARATHLMHLEESRHDLYRATSDFLSEREQP